MTSSRTLRRSASTIGAIDSRQWLVLSPLLDEVLELAGDERSAWMRRLAAERPAAAAQVQAVLDAHDAIDASQFLTGTRLFAGLADETLGGVMAGQTLGAYRLESLIGQGGMGNVWLARRNDGRYTGAVAIKLLNIAMIGQTGGERFEREVQILARLSHPHIARLMDAGRTDAGQPYLVLEYIEGETIDRHCDSHQLDAAARIRLFLEVLDAVAHSHANLIVHRDIKPLNVLVDTGGHAKLLDFGIAKLLQDELLPSGEATQLTQQDGRALTPNFAAPEQLLGQPVTTATDVYALGVLLYLLLSGHHPAGDGVRSIADIVKAVVDTETRRMSDIAEGLLKRQRRALKGDLDTIVAKALRKNPVERYATVDAFADDLRRHLDHLPVSARSDTLMYRLGKLAARHRAAVAAGGLAMLAIVAGLVGTVTETQRATEQARRAELSAHVAQQQRDRALKQLTTTEATDEFLSFLLQEVSDKPLTRDQLLARGEQLVDKQFAADPVLRARLLLTLANLYSEASEQIKAQALYQRAQAAASGVADASLQASLECGMAERAGDENAFAKAGPLFDQAIARLEAAPDKDLGQLATCLSSRSMVDTLRGDPHAALTDAQAALRYLGDPRPGQRSSAIVARQALADALANLGQQRRAVDEYQATLDELIGMGREHTVFASTVFNALGVHLSRSGQWLRAMEVYRRGIAVASEAGGDAAVSPAIESNYAKLLVELGHTDEAKSRFEFAIALAKRRGHVRSFGQVSLIAAPAYCASGDLARCDALLQDARERLVASLPPGHATFGSLETVEAQLALARHQPGVAREHLARALAIFRASPDKNPNRLRAAALMATAQLQLGDSRAALEQSVLAVRQAREALDGFSASAWLGEALLVQGEVQQTLGDKPAAIASAREAVAQLHETLGEEAPATRAAADLLEKLYAPAQSSARSVQ